MPVKYKDYYQILGIDKSADADAIKRTYRRLARKYHPDVNKGKGAAERFKEVNEAYEVLSDPEKRKRYDMLGADWSRYSQQGFRPEAQDFGGFRHHFGEGAGPRDFDLGGFSDFFKTFFGDLGVRSQTSGPSWGRRIEDLLGGARTGSHSGQDFESAVEINLEEAFSGTKHIIELETDQGHHRRLEVKIPPGIRDGARVRVSGERSGGRGLKGDLYLVVRIRPHTLFERKGDDLHIEIPVSVVEAALGAEIEVPTLRGKVSMKIPPETSSGKTFRLTGYGMPHMRGEGAGDQLVKVRVVMPSGLTPAERRHFEELRRLRRENPRERLGFG